MPLRITRIELVDFRNYASFVFEPSENLTILVGPNAVGKTNIVEAIQLVTAADSFRNPAWGDLVREGAEQAAVLLEATGDDGHHKSVSLAVVRGRRSYRVNGSNKRSVADVAGVVPAVVFTPDDLALVKGSADRRRSAIDALGSQISKAYGAVRAEYDRIVRQRNALLKDTEVSDEELGPWTYRLVEVGAHLTTHRIRLFDRLLPHMTRAYSALSGGEGVSAAYIPSWVTRAATDTATDEDETEGVPGRAAIKVALGAAIERLTNEERARKTTLVGPHRDDIEFRVNGREARAFGSQGQQRTIALAWKIAEIEAIEEITGTTPILLLDDVMSELDESRRHALAAFAGGRTQTLVTTTNLGYFEPSLAEAATVVRL